MTLDWSVKPIIKMADAMFVLSMRFYDFSITLNLLKILRKT